MGGDFMNQVADEEGGEDTSTGDKEFDSMLAKSADNPILGKAFEFIDNQLSKK